MLAGATYLQCLADFKSPLILANDPHWLRINAVMFLTDLSGERRAVHCLFHYCREDKAEVVEAGTYAILASVCVTIMLPIPHILMVSHLLRL